MMSTKNKGDQQNAVRLQEQSIQLRISLCNHSYISYVILYIE